MDADCGPYSEWRAVIDVAFVGDSGVVAHNHKVGSVQPTLLPFFFSISAKESECPPPPPGAPTEWVGRHAHVHELYEALALRLWFYSGSSLLVLLG